MKHLITALLLFAATAAHAETVAYVPMGTKAYIPACAEYDRSRDCTIKLGEVYRVFTTVKGRYANVFALGKDYLSDKHRWLMSVSEYQGDFAVPDGCLDETDRSDLPRIVFQPRFPAGCAQPDEYTWINITPTALGCGLTDRCTAVLYLN